MPVLTVLPDNERVRVKPDETILGALSASGYGCRVGCRRGGCGVCKVDLRDGSVHYAVAVSEEILTAEEVAAGTALACRAIPEGDVTIELRNEHLLLRSALLRSLRTVPATTTKE